MPPRPIIFLDMDDVLCVSQEHTSKQVVIAFKSGNLDSYAELWAGLVFNEARANLAALHAEFGPQYVVSSSWSNYLSQEQMQEVFCRTGLDFVAHNMHKHWTTRKGIGPARMAEITTWISKYRQKLQPMLILDDHDSGWNLYGSHLDMQGYVVLCEPGIGLVAEKLEKAQKIIRLKIERYSKYDTCMALMKRLSRPMSPAQMDQAMRLGISPVGCDRLNPPPEDAGLGYEVRTMEEKIGTWVPDANPTALLAHGAKSNVEEDKGRHMKVIGEFKCPKCGSVHIGISDIEAIVRVESVNGYYATLTEEERDGRCASIDAYLCCFRCGTASADFVPTNPSSSPLGSMLPAVIAPIQAKT